MSRPWYEVLGVAPNADAKTVKKKYRDLGKLYHPDANLDGSTDELFKEVANAYKEFEQLGPTISTTSKFTVQKCPPINVKVGSGVTSVNAKILKEVRAVCGVCGGSGKVVVKVVERGSIKQEIRDVCQNCRGKGVLVSQSIVEEKVDVDSFKVSTMFGVGNQDLLGYDRGDIIIS